MKFIKKSDKAPILVAYNGKSFDFPILMEHLKINNLSFS